MSATLDKSLFDFIQTLTGGGYDSATDRTVLDYKLPNILKLLGQHVPNIDTVASAVTVPGTSGVEVLALPVDAETSYLFVNFLSYTCPAADDATVTISGPASTAGAGIAAHLDAADDVALSALAIGTPVTVGGGDSSARSFLAVGQIKTDETAGELTVKVAKAADAGDDASVAAGFLLAIRVS